MLFRSMYRSWAPSFVYLYHLSEETCSGCVVDFSAFHLDLPLSPALSFGLSLSGSRLPCHHTAAYPEPYAYCELQKPRPSSDQLKGVSHPDGTCAFFLDLSTGPHRRRFHPAWTGGFGGDVCACASAPSGPPSLVPLRHPFSSPLS